MTRKIKRYAQRDLASLGAAKTSLTSLWTNKSRSEKLYYLTSKKSNPKAMQ
jgi:hypothetical protein